MTEIERAHDLNTLPTMEWWLKHDPLKKDSNWGRGCLLCDRAVPAGSRSLHGDCAETWYTDHGGIGPSCSEDRKFACRWCGEVYYEKTAPAACTRCAGAKKETDHGC